MTSADYALQAVKGIKEVFNNGAMVSIAEYMNLPVFDMRETNEWNEIFNSLESVSGTKELAELETPPVIKLDEGYQVTLSPKRYGSSILVSETMIEQAKDNTTKIDNYLAEQNRQLLADATQNLIETSFEMLNDAFDSGATTLAPDAVQLCGTHSWNSDSGTDFVNAVADEFSLDAVDTAMEYAGAFVDPAGKPMILNFDTIIVKKGSAVERLARKLFAEGISPTAYNDVNIYEGEMTIVSTPYITSTNKKYWFLMDTSKGRSCLYVGIHKYPTMNEPIVEKNQAVYSSITSFFKTGITNLPYTIYGGKGSSL